MDRESQAVLINALRFSYSKERAILDIPKLTIERGERVFVHGPSGCGKTTLLGIIAGILDPQGSQVLIHGSDLAKMRPRQRDVFRGSQIGYIFQMFNLIPYLNVLDNITLPCFVSPARRDRLGSTSPIKAAGEIASKLDIQHLLNKMISELSVGEQQRVAAARALLGAPALLIADEPTSALDGNHRDEFISLLNSVADESQATVLFVSHDLSLSRHFGRQISLPGLNVVNMISAEVSL